jgi:electron-transferring-flavoprotein dehydrogenase
MSTTFKPITKQPDLSDAHDFIIENPTLAEESVPMDVLFVGAGPAGLAGAIKLAQLVKDDPDLSDIEIGVLEKAESLGGHTLSGAVINPVALQELFPNMKIEDFPFKTKVDGEAVYLLTENGKIRLPTPPTMQNHGNYSASLCEVVRWMGEKAEELGVNVFTSFPADSLLVKDGKVIGTRTTPTGLNKDGSPGPSHMEGTDVTAEITVLTEGTRGPLAQSYMKWAGTEPTAPQIYALGVKEVWKVKKPLKKVIHTLGFPLPRSTFGGSWAYPMGDDMISLGLVAGLDYKEADLDVHYELQQLKKHPLFKEMLEGGELLQWGAKTIPEGGLHSFPKTFAGNGIMLSGDCVGMVNVPALKGIHYAMLGGIKAAETAYEALQKKEYDKSLKAYDQRIKDSIITKDLHKVRDIRQAFKSGFWIGTFKAALLTLTGGAFPAGKPHEHEDADEVKVFMNRPKGKIDLQKVDAVFQSANKTRDDLPNHLTVGEDISKEWAEFYMNLCPAGVYEMDGDKLVVKSPNCVDCKATDVLGPRWQPREGGAGPSYTLM